MCAEQPADNYKASNKQTKKISVCDEAIKVINRLFHNNDYFIVIIIEEDGLIYGCFV